MLARVAESIYWMTRYLERAENTARLINTTTNLVLDLPKTVPVSWGSLIEIMGSWPWYEGDRSSIDEQAVMHFLVDATDHPSSIQASVRTARENARTIREMLPAEVWESINALYFLVREHHAGGVSRRRRFDYLRRVILQAQQINGVVQGTLSRGAPYQFVALGRHLERADMTSRIVDVRAASLMPRTDESGDAWDDAGWMSVLRSLGGYIMYRQYMSPRIRGPQVVEFLFMDERFPRAIRFCLRRMEEALDQIPRGQEPLARLIELEQSMRRAAPGRLELPALHRYVDELQGGLGEVHAALAKSSFPTPP